jgi:hypothetical protein
MGQDNLPQKAEVQQKVDQRKHPRHIVLLRLVHLEHEALRRQDAFISEISVYGCRLYSKAVLAVGDRISLSLDGIQMTEATIIWRDGARAGCRFYVPIGMDVIKQLAFDVN